MKETNKSDFSRSRIGDRVWSPFGPECAEGGTNGKVVRHHENTLNVVFDNGRQEYFWDTGLQNAKHSFPSLFWCRPAIEIPPPPRRTKWVEIEVSTYKSKGEFRVGNYSLLGADDNCGPIQTIKVEVYDE